MIFELNIINMYTLQQFAGFRFQSVNYLGSSHVDLYMFPVCYLERSIYSRLHSGLCPGGCNRLQKRHKQGIVSWLYMQNS